MFLGGYCGHAIFFFPVFDVIICNVLYDTLYIELFIYAEKEKIIYTKRKKTKGVEKKTYKKTQKGKQTGRNNFCPDVQGGEQTHLD